MSRKDIVITAVFSIIATLAIFQWLAFSIRVDETRSREARRYEECVRRELGTTPAAYRLEFGHYPDCVTNE